MMIIFYVLAAIILAIGLVLLVRAFLAPERKFEKGLVAVMWMVIAGVLFVAGFLLANSHYDRNMGPSMMFPYRNPATVQTETAPDSIVTNSGSAETNFVPTSSLPECFPVNGPWLDAFAKGLVYEIDPASAIFDQSAFNYFEGVVVPSEPGDLHSVFEMKDKFVAEQGNIWTCGVVSDLKVKHTVLFQSADKKWQNWDIQPDKPFHDIRVITSFALWTYDAGIKPAWALEADDTNLVCPFTQVSMSNPAGVILPDGSFVGAPGKAGCDFVAIYPDGQAVRYHDAIDNFPYPAGTRFFLFEKKLTNAEVAQALNIASVTDAK